jgi:23S rRNA A2030 N6-methylase RlmJ
MEPTHRHPAYEETLTRVATILDVIAQQEDHTRRAAETDARIDKLAQAAQETQRELQEFIAHARERDDETTDKLNGLIGLMDRHVREHDRK